MAGFDEGESLVTADPNHDAGAENEFVRAPSVGEESERRARDQAREGHETHQRRRLGPSQAQTVQHVGGVEAHESAPRAEAKVHQLERQKSEVERHHRRKS